MSDTASFSSRVSTSVARELVVAVTGLGLIVFILGHLVGNMLIFAGPEALNGYAEKLASLGELLWVLRLGLITFAVLHIGLAAHLTWANWSKRTSRYAVTAAVGRKSVASQLMIYSGIIILCFFFFHLWDFTFGTKTGPGTVVPLMGGQEELGLFGLVWNSFANPLRAACYIVAVCCVGLHLSHAIASVWVTLGVLTHRATDKADAVAWTIGVVVALGFASIPIYVLVRTYIIGQGA